MNRRTFLTRVSAVAATAFIATKLPLSLLPEPTRRFVAIDFLHAAWVRHTRGTGVGHHPREMFVSPALYRAYENDLDWMPHNLHFTPAPVQGVRYLMFKNARLQRHTSLKGWDIAFVGEGTKVTIATSETFWRNRHGA